MGIFDFFKGERSNVEVADERIWLTKAAKFDGVAREARDSLTGADAPDAILLTAHFQDCLGELRARAESAAFETGRVMVASADALGGCAGVLRVAPSTVGLIGVDDIEEMMWDTNAVLGRGLGCSDIHVPKDLHRIGIDDLAFESICEFDRERGLPGSRRTGDNDNGRQMRRSGLDVRARRFFGGVVVHGAADPSSPFKTPPTPAECPNVGCD